MRRPTDGPPDAVRLLRADLYAHCLNYLMHKIDELHQSSRSIMNLDRAQLFHFVHDTNSVHGVFGDVKGSSCKTIRVIAQLGSKNKLNPYFSLTATGKHGIPSQRITTQRTKLSVTVPGSVDLPDEYKELLINQFRVADLVQSDHDQRLNPPSRTIKVTDLIQEDAFCSLSADLTSSERMWVRSFSHFEDPDDRFNDYGRNSQTPPETLASWPDPEKIYGTTLGKPYFKLNKRTQVYDEDGEHVHPSNYDKILIPGTWIEFDAHIKLWDFSQLDGLQTAPGGKSRNYQWQFTSVRVLLPPFNKCKLPNLHENGNGVPLLHLRSMPCTIPSTFTTWSRFTQRSYSFASFEAINHTDNDPPVEDTEILLENEQSSDEHELVDENI